MVCGWRISNLLGRRIQSSACFYLPQSTYHYFSKTSLPHHFWMTDCVPQNSPLLEVKKNTLINCPAVSFPFEINHNRLHTLLAWKLLFV